jgi:hypothetical protein
MLSSHGNSMPSDAVWLRKSTTVLSEGMRVSLKGSGMVKSQLKIRSQAQIFACQTSSCSSVHHVREQRFNATVLQPGASDPHPGVESGPWERAGGARLCAGICLARWNSSRCDE